ncbi:plasmid related protein [Variovorax sp. LT1R16]|uniref:plasmid related protein n=1 Tax=Variovorax sp. LT1R16 TaxID=3443728 RepID=UPI003F4796A0
MLFATGRLLATPAALDRLKRAGSSAEELLLRHASGDWGDIHPEDRVLNDQALRTGSRLLSAYRFDSGRIYIITEWDRSCTTVLLASEY